MNVQLDRKTFKIYAKHKTNNKMEQKQRFQYFNSQSHTKIFFSVHNKKIEEIASFKTRTKNFK